MVWITRGQTFASPIDRAVFLQCPVGFCSGMSTPAPIDWATAGSCVQPHPFKKICCIKAFFSVFEKTLNKEHLEVFWKQTMIFHNKFQALKSTQAVYAFSLLQFSSSDFILDTSTSI